MKRITIAERSDWRDKARAVGFGFHEMYGEPYWVDDAAYVFSLEEIETRIEAPSQELHDMCMDLIGDIVENEEVLDRLAIPDDLRDVVRRSWQRQDRHLYGRFDLAYDGEGPAKLLEYNADTPTSVFETAYFQFNWLTDQQALGALPADADQYNLLQESLVEAFEQFPKQPIFHFAAMTENEEDRGTTVYLMDCALQAGHRVELLDIGDIGIDAEGRFTDLQDRVIDQCFKLYPWEFMLREPFSRQLARSGDVFVEPAWKSILSNKGLLPLLWQRHPNHPNLLPSFLPTIQPPQVLETTCESRSCRAKVKTSRFSKMARNLLSLQVVTARKDLLFKPMRRCLRARRALQSSAAGLSVTEPAPLASGKTDPASPPISRALCRM